jgi:rRNA-processing protein FCF1
MLDTNTLDYIYDNKMHLVPKLRNLSKKKYSFVYYTYTTR